METAGYVTLTRQSGLMREMQSVAQNIANAATTGYRREGVIFTEHIRALDGPAPSLSMASARAHSISPAQGALTPTGASFDFAIEGAGFFLLDTPEGQSLTRAGSFTPNAEGDLVSPEGYLLLDSGGAPIFIPPDARDISLAPDGTLSAGGRALGQVGLYLPADPATLTRQSASRFSAEAGVEAVETPVIVQGFLENSNVNPITEIARMIAVQRAYELGQSFLDQEDARVRNVLQTLGR